MAKTHIKLQILQYLTTWLEGITVENGFQHDLAAAVYRGKDQFGANDKGDIVSLLEAKATDYGKFADEDNIVRKDDWIILVQGWADDNVRGRGPNDRHQTDAVYALLGDVEQRLGQLVEKTPQGVAKYPGVYRMGGLVADMRLSSSVVRPAEQGLSAKAFFYLPIRIGMAYSICNPWQAYAELRK